MKLIKFGTQFLTTIFLSASLLACSSGNSDSSKNKMDEGIVSNIGVNGYLWIAALDTVSDMPILQVDSAGGVILTDWIINPDVPTERLKLSVYIVDKVLRADALHVKVVRQELLEGVWVNASVKAGTELQIEDSILARARELKIQSVED